MAILRLLALMLANVCICACAPPGDGIDDSAIATEAGRRNSVEQSRGAAAAEAMDLLPALELTPDSDRLRSRFLHLFNIVFVKEGVDGKPALRTVPVEMLARAHQFAQTGDAAFLEALMYAALGWYGRSAEGGEGLNEVLWENLAAAPQLTLDTLARLPADVRAQLIEQEYTAPVHDGFDFIAIVAGLKSASVPAGLETDVAQILATAEQLAPR